MVDVVTKSAEKNATPVSHVTADLSDISIPEWRPEHPETREIPSVPEIKEEPEDKNTVRKNINIPTGQESVSTFAELAAILAVEVTKRVAQTSESAIKWQPCENALAIDATKTKRFFCTETSPEEFRFLETFKGVNFTHSPSKFYLVDRSQLNKPATGDVREPYLLCFELTSEAGRIEPTVHSFDCSRNQSHAILDSLRQFIPNLQDGDILKQPENINRAESLSPKLQQAWEKMEKSEFAWSNFKKDMGKLLNVAGGSLLLYALATGGKELTPQGMWCLFTSVCALTGSLNINHNKQSFIDRAEHVSRAISNLENTQENRGIRELQNSDWGFLNHCLSKDSGLDYHLYPQKAATLIAKIGLMLLNGEQVPIKQGTEIPTYTWFAECLGKFLASEEGHATNHEARSYLADAADKLSNAEKFNNSQRSKA